MKPSDTKNQDKGSMRTDMERAQDLNQDQLRQSRADQGNMQSGQRDQNQQSANKPDQSGKDAAYQNQRAAGNNQSATDRGTENRSDIHSTVARDGNQQRAEAGKNEQQKQPRQDSGKK